MHQKLLLWLCLLAIVSTRLPAQCAAPVNCPAAPDTICDLSANSAFFWNESYWYDLLYSSNNLAEGSVDLPFFLLDTCGTGSVAISYVLLLDLNNDGLRETAVTSGNLPPVNTVYFGNAANANYTGGVPRKFDERIVPSALRYGFALEVATNDDTLIARVRWINQATIPDTINVQLPAGTHRIEWRMEQNGIIKTCQYNFTVRDCGPPLPICQSLGFNVYVDTSGLVSVPLSALLISAEDNYTPTAQLQLSLREGEAGALFPVDSAGNPLLQRTFDCTELGFHLLTVWAKDKVGLTSFCQAYVIVEDTAFVCSPPPPVITELCARHHCSGAGIEGVVFEVQGNPAVPPVPLFGNGITDTTGCLVLANALPLVENLAFQAKKDDNSLNGVSTFDLVLISRHILGLQAFDSPYKLIAADANKSNSVTTFDVVELRKLILGIYQKLPNNTSWRFVNAAYVFPNADNPFQAAFPENVTLANVLANMSTATFYGIKVGDVNCSALSYATSPAEDRATLDLRLPDLEIPAGRVVEVPLRLAAAGTWLGWQGSLIFDPREIEILHISSAKLPGWSPDNLALLPGQVNLSWSAPHPVVLRADDDLLTVRIKTLAPVRLSKAIAFSRGRVEDAAALRPEGYGADGSRFGLSLQFILPVQPASAETAIFAPQPNPTFAGVSIPLHLAQAEKVTLEITDMTGRTLLHRTFSLYAGAHWLDVPAQAFPQSGLYGWRVQVGTLVQSGKLVKL